MSRRAPADVDHYQQRAAPSVFGSAEPVRRRYRTQRPMHDWVRTVIATVAAATLGFTVTYGIMTKAARADEVRMVEMPGTGKFIPMPGAEMRARVDRLIKSGRAQAMVKKSPGELNARCGDGYLLGCTTATMCALGVVYVRTGMPRKLTRMAYEHELAHCLGWSH